MQFRAWGDWMQRLLHNDIQLRNLKTNQGYATLPIERKSMQTQTNKAALHGTHCFRYHMQALRLGSLLLRCSVNAVPNIVLHIILIPSNRLFIAESKNHCKVRSVYEQDRCNPVF